MDIFTKEKRSEIMSHIRSKSGIENLPCKYKGLYLRKHPKRVFGNPDFGNKAKRIVLFIDGCFWHGCPLHYKVPKGNRNYWGKKNLRNMKGDREVSQILKIQGYKVIRVWECEL